MANNGPAHDSSAARRIAAAVSARARRVTPRGKRVNVASPTSRCAPWAASHTPVPICPASSQEADPSSGAAAVAIYTAIEGMTTRSHVPSTPSAPARIPRNQLSGRVKPRTSRARGSMVRGRAGEVEGIRPWSDRHRPTCRRVGRGVALTGGLLRFEDLPHERGSLGWGLADLHTRGFECLLLRLGGSGGAGDDRTGVAHRLALRGGEPGDVADDRLGHVFLDVVRGAFLGVAADLTDHHDDVGLLVRFEFPDRIDVGGADDRVPADADRRGEPEIP